MFEKRLYQGTINQYIITPKKDNKLHGTAKLALLSYTSIGPLNFIFHCFILFSPLSDHAINWILGASIFSNSTKPCRFACHGGVMHGL